MSALRQQTIDAALVRGFSPRTHKSYQAVISKAIIIRRLRHGIGLLLAGSARNVTEAEGQLLGGSSSWPTLRCNQFLAVELIGQRRTGFGRFRPDRRLR